MAALYRHAMVPIASASTARRAPPRSTRAASSFSASSANHLTNDEEEEGALRKRRHRGSSSLAVGYERALSLWRHGNVRAAVETFGESSHRTTIDCRRKPHRVWRIQESRDWAIPPIAISWTFLFYEYLVDSSTTSPPPHHRRGTPARLPRRRHRLDFVRADGEEAARGGAVQVHSFKTRVETAPDFSALQLKCDEPLSNVAFNFNVRSYIQEEAVVARLQPGVSAPSDVNVSRESIFRARRVLHRAIATDQEQWHQHQHQQEEEEQQQQHSRQGPTLVHPSAQLMRFLWDRGAFKGCLVGV
jgi:hypothetical protein